MTNSQRISELRQQIVTINTDLLNCKPSRCTSEDIEDVSDNYQANLEYQWYYTEQMDVIAEIEADIQYLESLPADAEFDQEPVEVLENYKELQREHTGMHYGTDRYGNTGYFEDFEQSIGE